MPLFRTTIRQETVVRLRGRTAAGDRVFGSRVAPLTPEQLPAIKVYTLGQSDRKEGIGPPRFQVTVDLAIEVVVRGSSDPSLEDGLDALCEDILTLLLCDATWVRLFHAIDSIETDTELADIKSGHRLIATRLLLRVTPGLETWSPEIPDQFTSLSLGLDCLQPTDPNLAATGPDGRVEVALDITLPEST